MPPRQLADACRETAATEDVQPEAVEKDYYLTRVIWALAQVRGDRLLLKGGTCLNKVDLGYYRMSEDIDFVVPWNEPRTLRSRNAYQMNQVRESLRAIAPVVGVRLPLPGGEDSENGSHLLWEVAYDSDLVPPKLAVITIEASMRVALRPARRAPLKQLLPESDAPGYAGAYCWALDATEVRAEKVRAAFNRAAIRDFYDLGAFLTAGVDVSSIEFISLVDEKLREADLLPLAEQPSHFDLTPERRSAVESAARSLAAVIRSSEPPFDLDDEASRYDILWGKRP